MKDSLFLNKIWNLCKTHSLVDCAIVSIGEIGFCSCNTCSENEGDCEFHDECPNGFFCIPGECPLSLGFKSFVDCCTQPVLGDEHFCAYGNPCGEDEGDCDSNSECQSNQDCLNNCDNLDLDSEVDCQIGESIDDYYISLGTYTKDDCISEVRKQHPTANGAMVEAYCPSTCYCYAVFGMTGWSGNTYMQSCIFIDPVDDCKKECHDLFCGYNNCPNSLGFDSEVDCCGRTQIVSPNYPYYPPNTEETWHITAPTGSIINLQFHTFNVRISLILKITST